MSDETRLNEYSKAEWFDVARRVRPDITPEEYDAMWADFCAMKAERQRQRALN